MPSKSKPLFSIEKSKLRDRNADATISDVLDGLAANREDNSAAENAAGEQVLELCRKFPVYSNG